MNMKIYNCSLDNDIEMTEVVVEIHLNCEKQGI